MQYQVINQTEAFYIDTIHEITVTSLNSPPLCRFMLCDLFLQFISLLHQAPGVLMTQFELFSKKVLNKKMENVLTIQDL